MLTRHLAARSSSNVPAAVGDEAIATGPEPYMSHFGDTSPLCRGAILIYQKGWPGGRFLRPLTRLPENSGRRLKIGRRGGFPAAKPPLGARALQRQAQWAARLRRR